MAKGIIFLDKIPRTCQHIRGNKEEGCPFGGMFCQICDRDVMEHVIKGTKPDWCPIKPVYSDDTDSANVDKESVILSPKDMVKLLERTPEDDILMVEINDGNDESGVVTDICVGGGTSKGFTYIKVSTDI